MLKIKRAYDKSEASDGKRILIDRLWPRGLKKENAAIDEWMKDIAPSAQLRRWFAHEPDKWEEFKRRYREELKDKDNMLEDIRAQASQKNVTLVFSARDTEHNNAAALREFLS